MIDFEKYQQEVIKKTDNIQSLADQVERLESLQSRLDLQEENIKNTKKELANYKLNDYLLLTGDPAIIGVACSIVSDITNGKYNLLKWDKQEKKYYPISISLYEKGEIDEHKT